MHPRSNINMLGYVPGFIQDNDPRSAIEQINDRYISGWHSLKGFHMKENMYLTFPGDPPVMPLYSKKFRNETIIFYQHAWCAVVKEDGSFEVSRLD